MQCWSFMQYYYGNFLMHSWHNLCNVDGVNVTGLGKINQYCSEQLLPPQTLYNFFIHIQ